MYLNRFYSHCRDGNDECWIYWIIILTCTGYLFKFMTDVFTMFSQPGGFYSVDSGITIAADQTINMANLRMWHAGSIIDIGSGSGYSTLVPYYDDMSLLNSAENGWSIGAGGIYHLFYNTRGTCVDCEMTIHLYGTAIVPLPG